MNSDYSHPSPFLVFLLSLVTLLSNHKSLSHFSIFLFCCLSLITIIIIISGMGYDTGIEDLVFWGVDWLASKPQRSYCLFPHGAGSTNTRPMPHFLHRFW